MNEKVLKTLLKIEVDNFLKQGMGIHEAAKKAGEKVQDAIEMAEYETYCSEHDC
jgi:hypothetical protein